MPVPDYQSLMGPVLRLILETEKSAKQIVDEIADLYDLSNEDRNELIPSGKVTRLANRVHWAITYMAKAGLVERPRRGFAVTTERGKFVFQECGEKIDNTVLDQFEEFQSFKKRSRDGNQIKDDASTPVSIIESSPVTVGLVETPEERIESAADELHLALRDELLDRILSSTPSFFEQLIIDLMLAMNYGGSGAGKHLGKTADGGIDGVINEDPLGLDIVFLQAKRYAPGNVIGVSQIREFAGSLDERGAVKGVFVTTSTFAGPAKVYADRSPKRLILIDGEELTRLLIRYGVGVRSFRTVELKKLDEDYFSDTSA